MTVYDDGRVHGKQPEVQTTTPSSDGRNSNTNDRDGGAGGPLIINAKVYIIADKYDIPALKGVAVRMYKDAVIDRWNSPSFPASARLVYDNTAVEKDKLRGTIVEVALENLVGLTSREDFLALLQKNGEMAKDIIVALARKGIRSIIGDEAGKCTVCDGPTVTLRPLQEHVCASCREAGRYSRYSLRLQSLSALPPPHSLGRNDRVGL